MSQASRWRTDPVDPALVATLATALGDASLVTDRELDRIAASVDASHYLQMPKVVVKPRSAGQVGAVLLAATELGAPVVFRSGGTSLSGQAGTDSILIDVRTHFQDLAVLDGGRRVRAASGVTVRRMNNYLKPHKRRFGPDPASEIAATVGGVLANNASGMCCGTEQNSYRTLDSVVAVLPSGYVLDSAADTADADLAAAEPELHATLARLRAELLADDELNTEVRRQYELKNTMGYAMNSLLDFETPAEIASHLLVGSEGTLGFVPEATFHTVEVLQHTATVLVVFTSLRAANDALPALVASEATVAELLDASSLRVAQGDPVAADAVPDVEFASEAALLIEYQSDSVAGLESLIESGQACIDQLDGIHPASDTALTQDAKTQAKLWKIRKGLYATVAGARPPGTTALLEDIAVPVELLASVCEELITLFEKHGYQGSVIFGHAKYGNVHFLINIDFADPAAVAIYEAFTEDLVQLVLANGGTLKAEHGTGRIMAPFVQRQFGDRLYAMMWEIKRAFDPHNICNPGAVLTTNPNTHVEAMKPDALAEDEVNACVECGFCEVVCPSKFLTVTPRQRIATRRARYEALGENGTAGALASVARIDEQSEYDVIDTCAVDGMCQTVCPVGINTGDLVTRLRTERVPAPVNAGWLAAAKGWAPFTAAASLGLSVVDHLPPGVVSAPLRLARSVLGADQVPLLSRELPGGGPRRRPRRDSAAEIVYFPACVDTMFGGPDDDPATGDSVAAILNAAGIRYRIPDSIAGLCCGTPWHSKGMTDGFSYMIDKLGSELWVASDGGRLPIVVDNSSCTEGVLDALHGLAAERPDWAGMRILEAVDYVAESVLPHIGGEISKLGRAVIHPTCATTRLGSTDSVAAIAAALADEVIIPKDWGCCAFAGDRGLLHPELTASATSAEAAEIAGLDADTYVISNRTCGLGMTRATGREYRHVLAVLASQVARGRVRA